MNQQQHIHTRSHYNRTCELMNKYLTSRPDVQICRTMQPRRARPPRSCRPADARLSGWAPTVFYRRVKGRREVPHNRSYKIVNGRNQTMISSKSRATLQPRPLRQFGRVGPSRPAPHRHPCSREMTAPDFGSLWLLLPSVSALTLLMTQTSSTRRQRRDPPLEYYITEE